MVLLVADGRVIQAGLTGLITGGAVLELRLLSFPLTVDF
jgi:hypothetical protein